jgi:hypothetical protein
LSGYTLSQTELIWSYSQAATASVPTASAVTATNGWPAITVPAGYFQKLGDQSSSVKLVIQGLLIATATVPTFAFGLAFTQANPAAFSATNTMHTISSTVTPTAGSNFQYWCQWDITLRTLGAPGATSTLVTSGWIECVSGFASPFKLTFPPTGTGNTNSANLDVQQVTYLWPYITLGAATAGNTVTPQWGKLYGEN